MGPARPLLPADSVVPRSGARPLRMPIKDRCDFPKFDPIQRYNSQRYNSLTSFPDCVLPKCAVRSRLPSASQKKTAIIIPESIMPGLPTRVRRT